MLTRATTLVNFLSSLPWIGTSYRGIILAYSGGGFPKPKDTAWRGISHPPWPFGNLSHLYTLVILGHAGDSGAHSWKRLSLLACQLRRCQPAACLLVGEKRTHVSSDVSHPPWRFTLRCADRQGNPPIFFTHARVPWPSLVKGAAGVGACGEISAIVGQLTTPFHDRPPPCPMIAG